MRRLSLVVLASLAGCPSDTPVPACTAVDVSCAPGYVPTFDNVYTNTIVPKCSMTSSCHSTAGHQGGLSLADGEDAAYAALLATSTIDPSRKRVVPGDPACSLLIVRTASPGTSYQMPKGDPLSEQESCALVQWVAAGAMAGSAR
jgi:hypothetical protein